MVYHKYVICGKWGNIGSFSRVTDERLSRYFLLNVRSRRVTWWWVIGRINKMSNFINTSGGKWSNGPLLIMFWTPHRYVEKFFFCTAPCALVLAVPCHVLVWHFDCIDYYIILRNKTNARNVLNNKKNIKKFCVVVCVPKLDLLNTFKVFEVETNQFDILLYLIYIKH